MSSWMQVVAALSVLLTLVAAAAQAPLQLSLQPSSHACPPPVVPGVTAASPRTCTFRNLYLWRGRAYYVTEGPPPDLAKLGLDFELGRLVSAPLVGPDSFVAAATPARFAELLRAGGSGAADTEPRRFPLVYFWRAYPVMPDRAGGATCREGSPLPGVSNYYHLLSESTTILSATLCEQFGHCDQYANRSALRIVDVRPSSQFVCHGNERYPPYFHEALACFSRHPLSHINGSELRSGLVHVDTAWMGLGPRCRGSVSGCYQAGGPRLPPTPGLMASWRRVLGQCFKFDPEAAAPLHPVRLLLVDRLYESGRSILNVASVLRTLRARFSPQQVQLRLEYMEGLTIRQQAQLFAGATVVVHVHGAAMGNYVFLPRGAVALHLAPVERKWSPSFSVKLAKDLAGSSDIEVLKWANSDARRLHVVQPVVEFTAARRPQLAKLLANQSFWRAFLASPECPAGLDPQQRKVCQQFLMRAVTASYPPELLANLTEAAIARAFEKQGAAPAAAAQAGGAGQLVGPQAARPLQPSRVPLYAFAASAVCLLVWLAVRPQKAARWRPP
ncbi:hypothetical protein ABPG77_009244 [Micractinium sp. CCAP 211/92]